MLSRQRQHAAVRHSLHNEDSSSDSQFTGKSPVHYVAASQYLTDSSLSADVSQFDFANASTVCR